MRIFYSSGHLCLWVRTSGKYARCVELLEPYSNSVPSIIEAQLCGFISEVALVHGGPEVVRVRAQRVVLKPSRV